MALTIPALVVALFLLAAAEVLWRKTTGRSLIRRRDGRDGPVAAAGLELLDSVFVPGRQAEFAQRHTSLMRRDDADAGEPPLFAVDLEGGRVQVNSTRPAGASWARC